MQPPAQTGLVPNSLAITPIASIWRRGGHPAPASHAPARILYYGLAKDLPHP